MPSFDNNKEARLDYVTAKLPKFWEYIANREGRSPDTYILYVIFLAGVRHNSYDFKDNLDKVIAYCMDKYNDLTEDTTITTSNVTWALHSYCNDFCLPKKLVKNMEKYLIYYYVEKEPLLSEFIDNL